MGESSSNAFFYLLKEKVAENYTINNPSCTKQIHDWTGEDIKKFQDDLSNELNERISERWFYTHLKPKVNTKLPRIDMLNILSKYAGYLNWDDFKLKHKQTVEKENKSGKKSTGKQKKIIGLIIFALLGCGILILVLKKAEVKSTHTFCFYDKDMNLPILDIPIEITTIKNGESPTLLLTDKKACYTVEANAEKIKFIVKAPYYKTDTIERITNGSNNSEIIQLYRDDYALMILYFATSDVEDWDKRRNQLNGMIAPNAVIYQITENNTGMEMYNKSDFINKLTTPLQSLGDIEIIETVYATNKIISMRFIQR